MDGNSFVLQVFSFLLFKKNCSRKLFIFLVLSTDQIYEYFFDDRSIVFGIRELNSNETEEYCLKKRLDILPNLQSNFNFTSDYSIRVYTSACYYLDQNNLWKSDGLWVNNSIHFCSSQISFFDYKVGPLTNLNQTHCFSKYFPIKSN